MFIDAKIFLFVARRRARRLASSMTTRGRARP